MAMTPSEFKRRRNLASKKFREKYPERMRESCDKSNWRTRLEVMRAYCPQGILKCACPPCKEDNPLFLSIDHIHGGGLKHRKETGNHGTGLYHWLKRNNFPKGFQILCFNCNQGKNRNKGVCPHLGFQHKSVIDWAYIRCWKWSKSSRKPAAFSHIGPE